MSVLGYLYHLKQTPTRRTPRVPVANGPGFPARLGAAARAGLAAWTRARTRHAVERELSALPDHILNDIGLERDLIGEAAARIAIKAQDEAESARRARGTVSAAGAAKGQVTAVAGSLGCG